MDPKLQKGEKVVWKWGKQTTKGTVEKVEKKTVTKTLNGSKITRKGTADDPAVSIKQDDGAEVIKRNHELKQK